MRFQVGHKLRIRGRIRDRLPKAPPDRTCGAARDRLPVDRACIEHRSAPSRLRGRASPRSGKGQAVAVVGLKAVSESRAQGDDEREAGEPPGAAVAALIEEAPPSGPASKTMPVAPPKHSEHPLIRAQAASLIQARGERHGSADGAGVVGRHLVPSGVVEEARRESGRPGRAPVEVALGQATRTAGLVMIRRLGVACVSVLNSMHCGTSRAHQSHEAHRLFLSLRLT
jgi:hypothetical protein